MELMKKVCLVACLTLSLIGCGPPPLATVIVSGNVTLDGTPIEAGGIQFIPADGKNPTTGSVITAGKYSANVPKGKMKIRITAVKVVGLRKAYDVPDSPMENVTEEMVPSIYNTETTLEHDVQGTDPNVNFDLKGKE